jgi:hypothetical protein
VKKKYISKTVIELKHILINTYTHKRIYSSCSTNVESSLQIDLFIQNEANYKGRIQNTEYRRQNKKMCISICSIKDCDIIFSADCLGCSQVVISGWIRNEPKRSQSGVA